jgi:hypothetical protein
MPPGRPRTTCRSRNAGGKELRTWVSAAEYTTAEQRAADARMELGEYIRRAVLGERLTASPSPWGRMDGRVRLLSCSNPEAAVSYVRAPDSREGLSVTIYTQACKYETTQGLSDMGLAGVLMMEGVQPPTPEDLEWVRGGA